MIDYSKVLELHSIGYTNRKIARTLNINHKTVSSFLTRKGLKPNGTVPKPINKPINEKSICTKCNQEKSLDYFQVIRRGKPNQSRLGYCDTCRRQQLNKNLNSSPEKILKDMFNRLLLRCKKNNIKIDIDFEYFSNIRILQNNKCFYSEKELILTRGKGINPYTLTVDKVIPEKGYVKGNIVLCSKRFNSIKNDMSLEEMRQYTPTWYHKLITTKWLNLT